MMGMVSEKVVFKERFGVHLCAKMMGTVSEIAVLKERCTTLVSCTFAWKYDGTGFKKDDLKRCVYP